MMQAVRPAEPGPALGCQQPECLEPPTMVRSDHRLFSVLRFLSLTFMMYCLYYNTSIMHGRSVANLDEIAKQERVV